MTTCALTSFWTRKWVKARIQLMLARAVLGNSAKSIYYGKDSYWKGKLNYIEDNFSFLVSSVTDCTIGGHQDSVRIITTYLE